VRLRFRLRYRFRRRGWNRSAEARERILGFLAPVGAPETLHGGAVPMNRCLRLPGVLQHLRELVRHHRVVRLVVEAGEFVGRIHTRLGFADAHLNLSPVGHGKAF
jgi:hypothetical protein